MNINFELISNETKDYLDCEQEFQDKLYSLFGGEYKDYEDVHSGKLYPKLDSIINGNVNAFAGLINLTQHELTPEQKKGVMEIATDRERVKELLTFTSKPEYTNINDKAYELAKYAESLVENDDQVDYFYVLIGGAPYLMSALEQHLLSLGLIPVYSYSNRVSVETMQPDGSVVKTNVFRHLGYVEAV